MASKMNLMHSALVRQVMDLNMAVASGAGRFESGLRQTELNRVVDLMLDFEERPKGHRFEVILPSERISRVCLTSGGMDSTIAWYAAGKPRGVYVNCGQVYLNKELGALRQLGIDFEYFDRGRDCYQKIDSQWQHIIPGRNLLLLTIAAEMLGSHGVVHFGVLEGEGSGDRSIPFITAFVQWYNGVTGKHIKVQTMVERTKPGWLEWFIKQGYDLAILRHQTVSCYAPTEKPCGRCIACLKKYMAFVNNGIDIGADYEIHPLIGAKDRVDYYRKVLNACREAQDYSHYSQKRIREDLEALEVASK